MTRAILTAFILFGLGSQAVHANPGWKSGTSGGNAISFAAWRGTALGLATGWAGLFGSAYEWFVRVGLAAKGPAGRLSC